MPLLGSKLQGSGIPLFSVEKSPFLMYSMVEQAPGDEEGPMEELDENSVTRLLLDEVTAVTVLLEIMGDARLSVDDVEAET